MWSTIWLAAIHLSSQALGDLVGIPTVPFTTSKSGGSFDLKNVQSITVDRRYAQARDENGWTLIPPTLTEFANTFATDFEDIVGQRLNVGQAGSYGGNAIYLTIGNDSMFHDAAGRWTSEAYSIDVQSSGITVTGASPLGAWWGTRTILQQAALNNGTIRIGSGIDSPGWGTRGIFLDAARHYYPPDFIIEMCNWISFYKQNTFHIHLSDNLYNNVDIYSRERQLDLYAAFRLWSDDPAVAGLNKRQNESYTQQVFESMQESCAARGVTIIPEIEAPGHALVISQWKPELGIEGQLDLLNISNPDTIPTMEGIWSTFLPWMKSKVVHIGADEYADADLTTFELATAYNTFVNALNSFIYRVSGKTIRIWGTFPPQSNYTNQIPTNVTIQHWEFFEDDPYYDYIQNDYAVLNSDDAFYIVNKYSTSYPQSLNLTRIFHGNPATGGAYAPYIFDVNNATNNPVRSEPKVVGHVAAQWNDYGYNTSTYLEAYYSWREGLPALADKQWGGKLTEGQYARVYRTLQGAAPGQNLDRRVESRGDVIVEYDFSGGYGGSAEGAGNGKIRTIKDRSGNGYDARTTCSSSPSRGSGLQIKKSCSLTMPLTSKGSDYTLSFSILESPSSRAGGTIFTGPDSVLSSGNGTSTNIMLITAGFAIPLNYTLPTGRWISASLIGRGNQTFFQVDGGDEMEFIARIGVNGERSEDVSMSVVAPLQGIGGNGWEGKVRSVKLVGTA